MALRALHHGLRAGVAVLFHEPLFERACVHADADGDVPCLAGLGHGLDVFLAADVAGIDADFVDAARGSLEGEAVVKMDIRHQRHAHLLLDGGHSLRRLHVGDGDAHDIGARRLHGADLLYGGLHVPGLGGAHGLYRNGRAPADRQRAEGDLFRFRSVFHGSTSYQSGK